MYAVQFTGVAISELQKVFRGDIEDTKKMIVQKLKEHPSDRGKFFGRSVKTGLLYFEIRFYRGKGVRVFYTISKGIIIVSEVEKEGVVEVSGASTKKNVKNVSRRLGL